MTSSSDNSVTLSALDSETATLVHTAAMLAGATEALIRDALSKAFKVVRPEWVEEVILQTYLFAGFPRALNGAREWRKISGRMALDTDEDAIDGQSERVAQGEATCAIVYGRFYERLRVNIRELHPALDQWMIEEGYGKVLSRPSLDLARRELCIIAACAIGKQDRQLHSHLHGALHAGASSQVIEDVLELLSQSLHADDQKRYMGLWARVKGK